MKIYDISQEVLNCEIYPGDKSPQLTEDMRMANGDLYNLSSLSMCTHNGTHIDAPFHFIKNGRTVDKLSLEKTIGYAYVTSANGNITADMAETIIKKASEKNNACSKRILIKGSAVVTEESAVAFANHGVMLIGVESTSVGPEDKPVSVHKILLEKEVVLLEGIRLTNVPDGMYFLFSAPLNISGSDGSPCRAVLVDFEL